MNKSLERVRGFGLLLGLCASVAVGAISARADASVTGLVTVSAVEYATGSLLIQAAGVNYVGATAAATGCTANNQALDTLKIWLTMGQSALLSGKRLKVFYTTCSSTNYITGLDIWQ